MGVNAGFLGETPSGREHASPLGGEEPQATRVLVKDPFFVPVDTEDDKTEPLSEVSQGQVSMPEPTDNGSNA